MSVFLLSLLWEKAGVSSECFRGDNLFAQPFPTNSNLCPGRDLLRCAIQMPKTPSLPASLNLRHFWGNMLISTTLWKFTEVHEWSLGDRWGEATSPAPKHKATSPLSLTPAQVTPYFYPEFISSPYPFPANPAPPGTVSIRTHMFEKMLLIRVYISHL